MADGFVSRMPKPAGQRQAGSKGRRKPARKQPPAVQKRPSADASAPKVAGQVASRQRPLITAEQARLIEEADRRRRAIEQLMRRTA